MSSTYTATTPDIGKMMCIHDADSHSQGQSFQLSPGHFSSFSSTSVFINIPSSLRYHNFYYHPDERSCQRGRQIPTFTVHVMEREYSIRCLYCVMIGFLMQNNLFCGSLRFPTQCLWTCGTELRTITCFPEYIRKREDYPNSDTMFV